MQKRGQVTLFIIIGILILVSIGAYILFFTDLSPLRDNIIDTDNPQKALETCISENSEEIISRFLENNLNKEPIETNFFRYNNDGTSEKVPLFCTVGEFNTPCINQAPNLVGKLRNELELEFEELASECWSSLLNGFSRAGLQYEQSKGEATISQRSNHLILKMDNTLNVIDGETSKSYSGFEAKIDTRIFQLASLAQTITNYESTLCDFDPTGWMMAFPDIFIKRFRAGDQTKVYTLKDRHNSEEIKFAIRTCIIPAGI